jgi:hypothetical protein
MKRIILIVILLYSVNSFSQSKKIEFKNTIRYNVFNKKLINCIDINYYVSYKLEGKHILIYEDSIVLENSKFDYKSKSEIINKRVILDADTIDYLTEVIYFYFISKNSFIKTNLIEDEYNKTNDYEISHSDGPSLKVSIVKYDWIYTEDIYIELTKGNFIFEDKFNDFVLYIDKMR